MQYSQNACFSVILFHIFFFFNSKHVTGEEWMINQPGAYLPDVYEEVRNNKCSIEHLPTFSRKI